MLSENCVSAGVYKNTDRLPAAATGQADFDLIVDQNHAERFYATMAALRAVRGNCSPFHDNAQPGREDWFIPADGARFLHLDVTFGLHVGLKFYKPYLALDYADVAGWQNVMVLGIALPSVTRLEEARISLLRSVFKLRAGAGGDWVHLDPETDALLKLARDEGGPVGNLRYTLGEEMVACEVREDEAGFVAKRGDLHRLRQSLRRYNGLTGFRLLMAPFIEWTVHTIRRFTLALLRRLSARNPAKMVDRRTLAPRGIVVALMGPDGVGKSTQAARLVRMFQRKFRCTSIYLGSNDGGWTAWRGRIARKLSWRSQQPRSEESSGKRQSGGRAEPSARGILLSAVWRLIIAGQRLHSARRALRLARSGVLVISDRWPQNMRFGYLDGPSVPPPARFVLASFLNRMEHRIYAHMVAYQPDLYIHFLSDFETTEARKPGDTTAEAFALRLQLLEEMRALNPNIPVVDARQELDVVTSQLGALVWSAMCDMQSRQPQA